MSSLRRNNAYSTLALAHKVGDDSLVLKAGEGSRFGSPTAEKPIRVTVAKKLSLVNGQIAPTSVQTIYLCTARSGDTLSGLTAVEETVDQAFNRLDPVANLITAKDLDEIEELASSGGNPDAVLTTESYADPDWLTAVSPEKVTGLDASLAAKADADSPTLLNAVTIRGQAAGTGGDRWNLQDNADGDMLRVDPNGTLYSDLAVNPSFFVDKIVPQNNAGYPVTYNRAMFSTDNGDGTFNSVMANGWNNARGPDNSDEPFISWRIENNYPVPGSPGHYQFEWGLDVGNLPGLGDANLRPIGGSINKSTLEAGVSFQGSYLSLEDEANGPGWQWLNDRAGTVSFDIYNSGAIIWNIVSDPTVDRMSFGAGTRPVSFTLQGGAGANTNPGLVFAKAGVTKYTVGTDNNNTLAIASGPLGPMYQILDGTAWPQSLSRFLSPVAIGDSIDSLPFWAGTLWWSDTNADVLKCFTPTGNVIRRVVTGPNTVPASPGTASGTDAAVINAIVAILQGAGLCS